MSLLTQDAPSAQRERLPTPYPLKRQHIVMGAAALLLALIVALAAFGSPFVQLLGTATLALAFVIVALLAVCMLIIAAISRVGASGRTNVAQWLRRATRLAIILGVLVVTLGGVAVGSQAHASTPPILGSNGQPLSGSIATLEQVTLNGSPQWITIRGKNAHNPVLLFLMGGPGAGGFPDRAFLAPLEEHFVVVNWDQPGTGKSYGAVEHSRLTPQRYVDDGYALTQYLRARFHQDKIYVLGSSWGTILGIKLVQQHPDLFYAYVGHGQMVNTTENDIMGYQFALKYAADHGNTNTVNALKRNGPPPYVGDGMAMRYAAYMDVLQEYMGQPSMMLGIALMPHLASEYGLIDRVNFVRGFLETFGVVYPQLRDLDFTRTANTLDVPVYLLAGRADVNAMSSLTERYYNALRAPQKELIWFKSGHSMTDADTAQFMDVMVNHVLKQTQP
ncbi:MAG TPA: alpha/beta hydrolase [Ktedonobacterales bacterium]|nr:alpha/beta hydrolase [Ktedonobacterales bacterium]